MSDSECKHHTMKRTIESRPSVGSVAKVVLRRAVTLPQVTSGRTTIVIVRRGTLELARNGNRCTACNGQVIVIPAGIPFEIAYRPKDGSTFVAEWLMPCPVAIDRNVSREEMAEPRWVPRPVDAVEPAFRNSIKRAIEAIKAPASLTDVHALQDMREIVHWIEVKGGTVCAAPATSGVYRVWNILAADPTREWRAHEVAASLGVSVYRLRELLAEESTTFARLIFDVRMGHALSQILATNQPIYAIAGDIGHRSVAQFRIRFLKRYGVIPAAVRGYRLSTRARPISSECNTARNLVLHDGHSGKHL